MMNVVALSLLLLSLATAGVWSPESTASVKTEEPLVVMREGHRVFMVEFEREGVVDAAKKGTHNAIYSAADYVKATRENIRHPASQARDKVEETAEQALQVMRSGADKTKDAMKSTADKASNTVKDTASSVLHCHGGAEKELSRDEMVREREQNKSGKMYETVKEKVSETLDSVKDAAAGAKERMKDKYREAATQLPNLGQGIGTVEENRERYRFNRDSDRGGAEEIATGKTVRDYVREAGESLKHESYRENVDSTMGTARDLYDSAKETAYENIKETGEGLSRSSQAVKDKAGHLTGKVSDAEERIKETSGETYDSAKAKVSGVGEKIKETAGDAYDCAKGKVSGAGDRIKETAKETKDSAMRAGERIKETAKSKVSGAGEKIKETAGETYDSAKSKVSGAGEKIKETAGEAYDSAKGKVSGAGEKIKETAGEAYDSAKGKISGAGEKIKETAGESFDSAKDFTGKFSDASAKIKKSADQTYEFDRDGSDLQIQRALRHAGEAAIEKFRQAMDEAFRLSTDGDFMHQMRGNLESQFMPLLSRNAKDTEEKTEDAGVRIADLLKDSATNLSAGSCKWSHLKRRLTSVESLKLGTRIIHLLAFSTIYGSSVWVNLLAGHVLFAVIPRQQFALIQSKIYPVYFKTMVSGLATCLLAHSAIHPWKSDANIRRWQNHNLLFSLVLALLNMLFLEPRTTKAIFEKLRVEKEEGRGTDVADIRDHRSHSPDARTRDDVKYKLVMLKVNRKLKFLHRLSSIINMLTLMSLSWHLVYLSTCIKT